MASEETYLDMTLVAHSRDSFILSHSKNEIKQKNRSHEHSTCIMDTVQIEIKKQSA